MKIDWFDEGDWGEDAMTVRTGDVYVVKKIAKNLGDNAKAIHLEDDNGNWIEIMPDSISEYFEFVKAGDSNE